MSFKTEFKRLDDRTQITIKMNPDAWRQEAKKKGYTDIQAEILAELNTLNPLFQFAYGVEAFLNIEEGYGVRLHTRNREIVNIDIIYKPIPDAYEIKAYRLTNHGLDVEEITHKTDVFFMDLDETIRQILNEANK